MKEAAITRSKNFFGLTYKTDGTNIMTQIKIIIRPVLEYDQPLLIYAKSPN